MENIIPTSLILSGLENKFKRKDMQRPNTCWLTINRACNLRCEWCYGFKSSFKKEDDMSLFLAQNLIDLCIGNNISNFILIGGEPTVHPQFIEILSYLFNKNCRTIIVTNGIRLADAEFCELIRPFSSKISFSISLKGSSDEYYKKHCGYAQFNKVLKGIGNCVENCLKYDLSYVISADNIDNICSFAKDLKKHNINSHISFSFCNETIDEKGCFDDVCKNAHPVIVNEKFRVYYKDLDAILDGNFSLHQNHPLCVCDKDLINTMLNKKQVSTSCHVHNRAGVIFDTNGSILLCNHFVGYGIGVFGKDYCDATSFIQFWNSEPVVRLYKKLTTMPSIECKNCSLNKNCGGGCCIQWFNHSLKDYKEIFNSINK